MLQCHTLPLKVKFFSSMKLLIKRIPKAMMPILPAGFHRKASIA